MSDENVEGVGEQEAQGQGVEVTDADGSYDEQVEAAAKLMSEEVDSKVDGEGEGVKEGGENNVEKPSKPTESSDEVYAEYFSDKAFENVVEPEVKDFLIRGAKLFGLNPKDVAASDLASKLQEMRVEDEKQLQVKRLELERDLYSEFSKAGAETLLDNVNVALNSFGIQNHEKALNAISATGGDAVKILRMLSTLGKAKGLVSTKNSKSGKSQEAEKRLEELIDAGYSESTINRVMKAEGHF